MLRMSDKRDETGAQAAINQALGAEQQARNRIARCQAQAEEQLAAVREQARRIALRTDARIATLRRYCEQQIGEKVARLKDSAEAVRCLPLSEDARSLRLTDAVRRLAARLTGGAR